MSEIVQRRDVDFLLFEVFDLEAILRHPRYADHDAATVVAVLDTAQSIAEDYYLPLAAKLDENEPQFVGGKAAIPDDVKSALHVFAQAGMYTMSFEEEDGGLQLPYLVSTLANGMFPAANIALANYTFLTLANARLIAKFATEAQKAKYLPALMDGRSFGTMCLSETQAGSSLSDIKAEATPQDDGSYRISGSKMWISGGDHELTENIVHLVLAKIPGGLPGVKGISLFIVPRYRVNDDGTLGEWNNIALAGLNHKMGQRGTVNCLLNFGEQGECIGELVGEPGKGLAYMFHMMNEARITVGQGASMLGLAGYLHSLGYARERHQGRPPQNKNPSSPQVPIVEHADVKRMLLAQKASVEGAMSLVAYAASLIDAQETADSEAEKSKIGLLLDILTPIVKSWPAEYCLEANKHAIQILGGYGYTRDYPVERLYRDNRLNLIHEGTHGIQGLDLLGRKVRIENGAALDLFAAEVRNTLAQARDAGLGGYAISLEHALDVLIETTRAVVSCEDLNLGLSLATIYLDAFGHVTVAWQWLIQAIVATRALGAAKGSDLSFYEGKLTTCRYFFRYELPRVHTQLGLVGSLDDTCATMKVEQFG